ncbi:hypothetical protein JTB14_030604 [Gonioctena quinquepunctata]|nr:hypothetical protein JTB14_030604 [Gonioctena quinquepunctata]
MALSNLYIRSSLHTVSYAATSSLKTKQNLIQDEASQQLDLALKAELISIDPYDTLNVISKETLQAASGNSPHTNEGPSLEPNEESGLDLEEKKMTEPMNQVQGRAIWKKMKEMWILGIIAKKFAKNANGPNGEKLIRNHR